ncbi:MAG: type II toxin-antitoxin system PemK/MazF family toxin [Chloroflexi bacterium]|nr:type II toxin-antitoxin system PemK/MazF family toxin [Chloroflexota bacterium]
MTALQWAVIQVNVDPAIGTEQKGTRPVLIVSNKDYNQRGNALLSPEARSRWYVLISRAISGAELRRIIESLDAIGAGQTFQPFETIPQRDSISDLLDTDSHLKKAMKLKKNIRLNTTKKRRKS